jgi:DNA-directed RNA polymerase subunit RPC12/RpoP
MSDPIVRCPKCGGSEFNECSTAPVEADIVKWELRGGVPHPEEYENNRTFYEGEVLDDAPYKCTNCDQQFTAAQLIVEG